MDQMGLLHMAVAPYLCEGEVFVIEEHPVQEPEVEKLLIFGSRGATLIARFDDQGWTIKEVNVP
jgi:hypothetical protein